MENAAASAAAMKSAVSTPCAACKLLRRRCRNECVFAPYFPPEEPHKFAFVHRVFGASNVNKMLQDLPMNRRADAVSSMVYEAHARVRDPVYGCAGTVSSLRQQTAQLQLQTAQLQTQVVLAQAEIINLRMQRDHTLLSNMTNGATSNGASSSTMGRLTTTQGTSSSSEACQAQARPFLILDANDSRDSLWN